ncbi:MAG: hypothetical protein U1E17_04505 [Geminicoccaceae bacterium]
MPPTPRYTAEIDALEPPGAPPAWAPFLRGAAVIVHDYHGLSSA